MRAITTICNKPYQILLPVWVDQARSLTDMPIFVLAIEETRIDSGLKCEFIEISRNGNPFPFELPDHACAEKQRIFKHLPDSVSEVLFVDIDVMLLHDFWSNSRYFEISTQEFVACPDLFVGYKEKMEDEFRPFNDKFRMKYFPDGTYYYFNTGVFFASRKAHSNLFDESLKTWSEYVSQVGRYPSIFDQNVFNYCLIRFGIEVCLMPIQNNCLRQYDTVMKNGELFLDNKIVNAMHFNGGEAEIKLSRWMQFARDLEESK